MMARNRRQLLVFAVFVIVGSWAAPLHADDQYEREALKGYRLIEKGDYAAAHRLFRDMIDRGDPEGYLGMADSYHDGTGVEQDYAKAAEYYEIAAEADVDMAQYHLARLYLQGWGVPQDCERAMYWAKKAADWRRPAMHLIGVMHWQGCGVPQDRAKAIEWYMRAGEPEDEIEKGYTYSQDNLGYAFQFGVGVEKDSFLASLWYGLAADQGFARSQNNLAWLLSTDEDVRDGETAVKYARRLVALEDNAAHSDTLAAAWAASGKFKRAVREQKRAIKKARAEGEDVTGFELRLNVYLQGRMLTCPGGPCE